MNQEKNKMMSAWRLHEAGLENLGHGTDPDQIEIPEIREDELLVRVNAVGLCFSDIKIIRAGGAHPKLDGRNLAEHPLIPGHEAVLTVVRRGAETPVRFAEGKRFLIQCDIFVHGRSCAYGYGMDGALTQYSVLDRRVWEGESESYLLEVPDNLSDAAVALIEPWTCVNAAYRIGHRQTPLSGGSILILSEGISDTEYAFGEFFREASPAGIFCMGLSDRQYADLIKLSNGISIQKISEPQDAPPFDDLFILGNPDRDKVSQVIGNGNRGAVISFIGNSDGTFELDPGALHYQNYYYQGEEGNSLLAPYRRKRREHLKKDGAAWMLGGAGAMGQMHTQLAVENPEGPRHILVTDLDDARLAHVKKQLLPIAEKRGIRLEFVNPSALGAAEWNETLHRFAPEGFDDIVLLVPSVPAAEQAIPFLKADGLFNVFAGIPVGAPMSLPKAWIQKKKIRFTGSSGSSTADMIDTLKKTADGTLHPERAMAAIGGMNAAKEGLQAVSEGRFPGKTVIYPFCPDLPLTPLSRLKECSGEAAEHLTCEGFYTPEAERILMERFRKDS